MRASRTNRRTVTVSDSLDPRVLKVAAVCVLGVVVTDVDAWIVLVAQRTFMREFAAPPSIVAWVLTAYTLALATVIPITGWATDRFGAKRLLISSLFLFAVGSLLCAAATNIVLLVTFRVIQGLAGGILLPLTLIIVARAAGPNQMGRLMVVLAIPLMISAVGAPILGGWLIDSFGWRWIFLINPPFCLLVIVLAVVVLPKDDPSAGAPLDLIGLLLLSPSVAALLYGISSIAASGTTRNPQAYAFVLVGCALLAGFVFYALYRARHPLIDLRLFRNRTFAFANATIFLYLAAIAGVSLLVPNYLQQLLGQTPLQSGLNLVPQALGVGLTMPIAGYYVDKRGPRTFALVGLALTAAGVGIFAYAASRHCAYFPTVLIGLVVAGMGIGFARPAMSGPAIGTLELHEVSRGSTLIGVNPPIAVSAGTALMAVILTAQFNRSPYVSAAKHAAAVGKDKTDASLDLSTLPRETFTAEFMSHVTNDLSHAYAVVCVIATGVLLLALIPAAFLPNGPVRSQELDFSS